MGGLYQRIEWLRQISLEIGEEVRGSLKVGIIPTLAPYLAPLFIDRLNSEYKKLQVEVSEIKMEEIISEIKMGHLGYGIISTPISVTGLLFRPLFYEKFYTYVSVQHPLFKQEDLKLDDILETDGWYLDEGNCFQNQVNSICQIN